MTSSSTHLLPRYAARSASYLQRLGRSVRTYLVAYRQAKSAEELYLSFARTSDRELARRGTTRQGLLQQVRKILDLAA